MLLESSLQTSQEQTLRTVFMGSNVTGLVNLKYQIFEPLGQRWAH